jgi:hypothetical protein
MRDKDSHLIWEAASEIKSDQAADLIVSAWRYYGMTRPFGETLDDILEMLQLSQKEIGLVLDIIGSMPPNSFPKNEPGQTILSHYALMEVLRVKMI